MTTVEEFVTKSLTGFTTDPADSDHQRGFLSAMIQVAEELMIDDQAPMLEELKAQLTLTDEQKREAAKALRESLVKVVDERNRQANRKPTSKKAKDAELEFLCGAGQALHAVGNPLTSVVTMWAFLQSTGRDPLRPQAS